MLKSFSTKQLIFLTLIGTLAFLIDIIITYSFYFATGITGIGYIVTTFFFVVILVVGSLSVKKFGAFTIMALVYAFLMFPIQGPRKLIVALIIGIIVDTILYFSNYKKLGYYLAGFVSTLVTIGLFALYLFLLKLPEFDKFISALPLFVLPALIEMAIAVWAGFFIYNKIKNKKIVKQISN